MEMILFLFTLSIDTFCMGLSYALHKIKIPYYSSLVISFISSIMLLCSIIFGIIIKNYIIFSIKDLQKYESEIKTLCVNNNARAYIWVNPRSYRLFQINLLKHTAISIENNNYSIYKLVDKAIVDSKSPNYEKVWILDIDSNSRELIDEYEDIICKCNCVGNYEYDLLETVNGYHLLSHRFNLTKFEHLIKLKNLYMIDIHKDNPTLLYYEKKDN